MACCLFVRQLVWELHIANGSHCTAKAYVSTAAVCCAELLRLLQQQRQQPVLREVCDRLWGHCRILRSCLTCNNTQMDDVRQLKLISLEPAMLQAVILRRQLKGCLQAVLLYIRLLFLVNTHTAAPASKVHIEAALNRIEQQ